jgi:hypothetical protein
MKPSLKFTVPEEMCADLMENAMAINVTHTVDN